MEQKVVPLVAEQRWYLTTYASPTPIPRYWVTRGMWGTMGKSENILWFYTVQSRSLQTGEGMPVMVALTPYSD